MGGQNKKKSKVLKVDGQSSFQRHKNNVIGQNWKWLILGVRSRSSKTIRSFRNWAVFLRKFWFHQQWTGNGQGCPPMSGPDSPAMNVMASSLNHVLFKQVYSRTISLIIIYLTISYDVTCITCRWEDHVVTFRSCKKLYETFCIAFD